MDKIWKIPVVQHGTGYVCVSAGTKEEARIKASEFLDSSDWSDEELFYDSAVVDESKEPWRECAEGEYCGRCTCAHGFQKEAMNADK